MASQVDAPLLSRQDNDNNNNYDFFEETPLDDDPILLDNDDDKKRAGRLGYFVWLLTLSAGISGLLFGCMSFILPVS